MKRFLKPIPLVVLGFAIASVAYATILNINADLTLRWSFDEYGGGVVRDRSGHGQTGTLENSPLWVGGHNQGALSFDGVNQYVVSDDGVFSLGVSNQSYTISAWVKIAPDQTDGNIVHLSSLSDGSGWCLPPIALREGHFSAVSFTGEAVYASADALAEAGRWYLVTNTWDPDNGLRLFIDGELVATTPQSSFAASGSPDYVWVGRGKNGCLGDAGYLHGTVDDVRVYSRALSLDNVKNLYGAQAPMVRVATTDGLIAQWPLDQARTENPVTRNTAPVHVSGTMVGSPPSIPSKVGQGLSFDGASQCVTTTKSLNDMTEFTIAGWVYPRSYAHAGFFGQNDVIEFGLTGENTIMGWTANGGYLWVAIDSGNFAFNTWHHMAFVGNQSEQVLYIDGIRAATTFTAVGGAYGNSAYTFNMGGCGIWGPEGDFFNGGMSDVRIYNRALTDDEMANLSKARTTTVNASRTGLARDGLMSMWSFDGADISWSSESAGVAYDRSGQDNHATFNGMSRAASPVMGRIGQALSFEGNQYLTIFRNVADDMTICAWFKTTGIGPSTDHWAGMAIYDAEVGGVSNDFGFSIDSNGRLMFGDGDGFSDYTLNGNTAINTGKWVHGCAVRYRGSGAMYLYVNGVQDAFRIGSISSLSSREGAFIGYGTDGATHFVGVLDDVRVYTRALPEREIHNLYLMGK